MTSSAPGQGLAIILLCAGIVLAMNTATADGSRALYGISQDGMTIRWLGKLNRFHVPANAMTVDALLNIFLLFTYASDPIGALKILVFSNLGYVLCHVFATSGFMLLRRDRPNWPRPIKVAPAWVAGCMVLFLFDLILLDLRRGQRRPRLRSEHAFDADPVAPDPGHRARAVRLPGRRPGEGDAAAAAALADDARRRGSGRGSAPGLTALTRGGPAPCGPGPLDEFSIRRRQPPLLAAPASASSCSASSRFWSAVIFLNSFCSARRLITWFQ